MPGTDPTVLWDCPSCGELTPERDFLEGVCLACQIRNQWALDEFLAAYDRWQALTGAERDREIRVASRREET